MTVCRPGSRTRLPLVPGKVMREVSVTASEDFTSAVPQVHRRQPDLVCTAYGPRFPASEQDPDTRLLCFFFLVGLRNLPVDGVDVPPR